MLLEERQELAIKRRDGAHDSSHALGAPPGVVARIAAHDLDRPPADAATGVDRLRRCLCAFSDLRI